MANYYYIGPDPRESASRQKGNGLWSAKAESMEEALMVIFGDMTYPAEATGRNELARV